MGNVNAVGRSISFRFSTVADLPASAEGTRTMLPRIGCACSPLIHSASASMNGQRSHCRLRLRVISRLRSCFSSAKPTSPMRMTGTLMLFVTSLIQIVTTARPCAQPPAESSVNYCTNCGKTGIARDARVAVELQITHPEPGPGHPASARDAHQIAFQHLQFPIGGRALAGDHAEHVAAEPLLRIEHREAPRDQHLVAD